MNTPAADSIKYLGNGQIVRVLAHAAANQIVVEIGHTHEDYPDKLFFDGTRVVNVVYDKPPVEAFDQTIQELERRKSTLTVEIHALLKQEKQAHERVEKLKAYDQLKRIEDFLAGKITHYVIYGTYHGQYPVPRISTPEQERSGDEDRNRYEDMKLLTLYGSKDRTLEWKLNYFSDGSGSSSLCIPCCSLEEAQEKARAILAESFKNYTVPERHNCQIGLDLVRAARALGAPIPAGFEAALRQCEINNGQAEVRQRQQALNDAIAKLNAVTRFEVVA